MIYLFHKKGEIDSVMNTGSVDMFGVEKLKKTHSDKEVINISEEDYLKIKNDLVIFEVIDGKVVEKSEAKKKEIADFRDNWYRENTIQGLSEKINELKQENESLSNLLKDKKLI
jgi:hypothetical protein